MPTSSTPEQTLHTHLQLQNNRVILDSRPEGTAAIWHFRIETGSVPVPGQGEVLVRTVYLSIDPYMLRVIKGIDTYLPIAPGDTMYGRAISEVVESHHSGFAPGDLVFLYSRWQEYFVEKGDLLRKIDPGRVPASAYLGVLGHSGLTAWGGLLDVGKPVAGETVVVSAAAGAVGSVVGQLAKIKGCRAVGIAGGQEKCAHVVDTLGFDACVDYKAAGFPEALRAAVPGGVDIYFESVGGAVFDAVLPLFNQYARVPLCGLISQYGSNDPVTFHNFGYILTKLVRILAFRVGDYLPRMDEAMTEMSQWFAEGRLKHAQTIAQGIQNAPAALVDMLSGRNIGKQLVQVAQVAPDARINARATPPIPSEKGRT